MSYIRLNKVLYEYFIRNDEGDVEGINTALKDVDLSVKPGDFICILGANGSGKSTLAKLLNALLIPVQGSVIVDGMDVKVPENTLSIRKSTAMVFQNPDNQIVAGVVKEDVAFGPENLGIEPDEIKRRVKTSLTTVGLWDEREKSPGNLSGGQKQKLAIAGVLAMSPKCIVFDEATSMLDPDGRREILESAIRLNKQEGMTIIFITHNMEEAIDADFVYCMEKGEIIRAGSPKEVLCDVDFLRAHSLVPPQVVSVAHRLRQNGVPLRPGILKAKDLALELKSIKDANNS